jgi:hypothetical protein
VPQRLPPPSRRGNSRCSGGTGERRDDGDHVRDFNCPCSYLASQRAGPHSRAKAFAAYWRAVEHERGLSVTGGGPGIDRAARDRELAEAASLALLGQDVPATLPTLISDTGGASAAYAEAVSDGVADEVRRRAHLAAGGSLSSAAEVCRLITAVIRPREDITARPATPDPSSLLLRDPDLTSPGSAGQSRLWQMRVGRSSGNGCAR